MVVGRNLSGNQNRGDGEPYMDIVSVLKSSLVNKSQDFDYFEALF